MRLSSVVVGPPTLEEEEEEAPSPLAPRRRRRRRSHGYPAQGHRFGGRHPCLTVILACHNRRRTARGSLEQWRRRRLPFVLPQRNLLHPQQHRRIIIIRRHRLRDPTTSLHSTNKRTCCRRSTQRRRSSRLRRLHRLHWRSRVPRKGRPHSSPRRLQFLGYLFVIDIS